MPEKIKLARTYLEPSAGMQLVLNPKFIKIVKRLYLKFFALYILLALSVFVLPENIGDNAACAGFVNLNKQFFKCRCGRIYPYARLEGFYVTAMWAASILILVLSCFLCLKSSAD